MKVAIRGKNIEVTDALRAYIEKRLSKLTRYFDDELNAQAVLSVVKDKSTIELTCFVDKNRSSWCGNQRLICMQLLI